MNGSNQFQLLYFGEAASVALALIVQVGEQVDFLRFLPEPRERGSAWWIALLSAGPGWIIVGSFKLLAGSFLAVYLVRQGVLPDNIDPPHMYASAFAAVVGSPKSALLLTCVFVVVCQLKINVTNAYAGSIAWSNFFSRLTHSHPGRVVWLIFNVVLALLVMELGVYKAIEQTLAFYSSVAVAWVGAIVADLIINKPLGLSPPYIEFKRAHLFDINPVGVGSMRHCGGLRRRGAVRACSVSPSRRSPHSCPLAIALICAPLIAFATRGRFLYRAHAQCPLGRSEPCDVLYLRERLRVRGYGAVSGLFGPDLLAVLLARLAVSGYVQAEGACTRAAERRWPRGRFHRGFEPQSDRTASNFLSPSFCRARSPLWWSR